MSRTRSLRTVFLPSAPLVDALTVLARSYTGWRTPLGAVPSPGTLLSARFGPQSTEERKWARRIFRAQRSGTVSFVVADEACVEFGLDPCELWGDLWWTCDDHLDELVTA